MRQVNASICTGMGSVGRKRLQRYKARAKARGYSSFSAYVVQLLERQLGVEEPMKSKRQSNKSRLSDTHEVGMSAGQSVVRGFNEESSNRNEHLARYGKRRTGASIPI